MLETIFWRVFTDVCIVGFFLGYGMVEDLIGQWRRKGRFLTARTNPKKEFPQNPSFTEKNGGQK